MSIRAGKLRHPIVIETATESQDEIGGITKSWATHAERMAGFETLSGREYFEGGGRKSEATARFWLRDDLDDVTTKMRVSYDSRAFNIEAVIPPEKPGGYLQLMVRDAA